MKDPLSLQGDLFPWNFDLREEVVEIAAHQRQMQSLLIFLRTLYALGFFVSTVGISWWIYVDGMWSINLSSGWTAFVTLVLVWCFWKLINEMRFLIAYTRHCRLIRRQYPDLSN